MTKRFTLSLRDRVYDEVEKRTPEGMTRSEFLEDILVCHFAWKDKQIAMQGKKRGKKK